MMLNDTGKTRRRKMTGMIHDYAHVGHDKKLQRLLMNPSIAVKPSDEKLNQVQVGNLNGTGNGNGNSGGQTQADDGKKERKEREEEGEEGGEGEGGGGEEDNDNDDDNDNDGMGRLNGGLSETDIYESGTRMGKTNKINKNGNTNGSQSHQNDAAISRTRTGGSASGATSTNRGTTATAEAEELFFSDMAVKTNRQGRRQNRVLVVTDAAVYNFRPKRFTKPTRRIPVQKIEALLLSVESSSLMVLHIRDELDYKYETTKRAAFIKVLKPVYRAVCGKELDVMTLPNVYLENAFRDKPGKEVLETQQSHADRSDRIMSTVFSEDSETRAEAEADAEAGDADEEDNQDVHDDDEHQRQDGSGPNLGKKKKAKGGKEKESRKGKAKKEDPKKKKKGGGSSSPKKQSEESHTKPPLSPRNARRTSKKAQQQPQNDGQGESGHSHEHEGDQGQTNKKTKKGLVGRVLRISSIAPKPPPRPKQSYRPACPAAAADLKVCQALWSLVERALAPLEDETDKYHKDPGLIRCADILNQLVGPLGPPDAGAAIRCVAALCFDKDAARSLLQSMDYNIPILGGSALVDSLDALQRCEDAEVRKWAIKGLWKLLPMCMSENAMPTTSPKWMSALSGPSSAAKQANEGESAFISTFFRGPIMPSDAALAELDMEVAGANDSESKRTDVDDSKQPNAGGKGKDTDKDKDKNKPTTRIGNGSNNNYHTNTSPADLKRKKGGAGVFERKGSYSVLGSSYRDSKFPKGLSYVIVQQAFAQVCLQNMFDLQRRATYSTTSPNFTDSDSDEDVFQEMSAADENRLNRNRRLGRHGGGSQHRNQVSRKHSTANAKTKRIEGSNTSTATADDAPIVVRGVEATDCEAIMEIILDALVFPAESDCDRRVDVIGKRIRNPVLIPTLMGMLVMVKSDSVRMVKLKEISLLFLRSEANLKCLLTIPDWPMLFLPTLQTVPRSEPLRNSKQQLIHKYCLNLLTVIHTYCFKEPDCVGGPLLRMLGHTFHNAAVFSGWNSDAIDVCRWILLGLLSQLAMSARHWWHNPDANEWQALLNLLEAIEVFTIMLPGMEDIDLVENQNLPQTNPGNGSGSGGGGGGNAGSHNIIGKSPVKKKGKRNNDTAANGALAGVVVADQDKHNSRSPQQGSTSKKTRTGQIQEEERRAEGSFSSTASSGDEAEADDDEEGGEDSHGNVSRAFSIIPIYSLKSFDPILKPKQPRVFLNEKSAHDWMLDRVGNGPGGEGSAAAVKAALEGKVQPGVGLHLDPSTGMCADLDLVEKATQLLRGHGITGNPQTDSEKRKGNKTAPKKLKALLKQASERASRLQSLKSILKALNEVASSEDAQLADDTMSRLSQLLNVRYKTTAQFSTLTSPNKKKVVNRIERRVLQQHQVARENVKKHKSSRPTKVAAPKTVKETPNATPVRPRHYSMRPKNTRKESIANAGSSGGLKGAFPTSPVRGSDLSTASLARRPSKGRKSSMVSQSKPRSSAYSEHDTEDGRSAGTAAAASADKPAVRRKSRVDAMAQRSSNLSRARFYSSVYDQADEGAPPLPAMPEEEEEEKGKDKEKEKEKRKGKGKGKEKEKEKGKEKENDGGPASALQSVSEMGNASYQSHEHTLGDVCAGCNKPCYDDFETVEMFDAVWHSLCLQCHQCGTALLNQDDPDDALYFDEPELRLFCGTTCRDRMLSNYGDDMCAGCMCVFVKGEQAVEAAGKRYHPQHLRCMGECNELLGVGSKKTYFERDGWPYCEPCYQSRFNTCAKCLQPTSERDDTIDALGKVWHRNHFACFKCAKPFDGGIYFVHGSGEQARAYCEQHYFNLFEPLKCSRCLEKIGEDSAAVELAGHLYHLETCFRCNKCDTKLEDGEVFEENGVAYCDRCYYESFSERCHLCKEMIHGDVVYAPDLYQTGEGKNSDADDVPQYPYHTDCLSCPDCDGFLMGNFKIAPTTAASSGKPVPYCELHYNMKFALPCAACSDAIESNGDKVEVMNKSYHKSCLVCHHCQKGLVANDGSGSVELNVGPDQNMYCAKHQHGVCAFQGCDKPAWTDSAYHKASDGEFYCKQHCDEVNAISGGELCARCWQAIGAGGGVQALGKTYHSSHFTCIYCDKQFAHGEDFVVVNGEPAHTGCHV